jgi:hypothetical protein
VNNLFDELITYRLLERRKIWHGILELEQMPGVDPAFRQSITESGLSLLTEIPVTEKQSVDPEFAVLSASGSGAVNNNEQKRHLLQGWEDFVAERLRQAQALVDDALLKQSGPDK